jgi:hypothetical protein
MNHNNVVSLPVGASNLTAHARVRLASGLVVVAGASDVDVLGHVLQDTLAGGTADVALKFGSGMHYAIASAAIANGALIGKPPRARLLRAEQKVSRSVQPWPTETLSGSSTTAWLKELPN